MFVVGEELRRFGNGRQLVANAAFPLGWQIVSVEECCLWHTVLSNWTLFDIESPAIFIERLTIRPVDIVFNKNIPNYNLYLSKRTVRVFVTIRFRCYDLVFLAILCFYLHLRTRFSFVYTVFLQGGPKKNGYLVLFGG